MVFPTTSLLTDFTDEPLSDGGAWTGTIRVDSTTGGHRNGPTGY